MRYVHHRSYLATVSLGLIFGGALGNLIDRVRLGYVTDFILVRLWNDFYWPAFNIADSAITIGALTLIIFLILNMKHNDGILV
jgi:signal peptidase II